MTTCAIQNKPIPTTDHLLQTTEDGHPDIRKVRVQFGMEQEEIANLLGVGVGTYRSWEQHQRAPSAAALTLLKIFAARPDVVCKVMGTKMPGKRKLD